MNIIYFFPSYFDKVSWASNKWHSDTYRQDLLTMCLCFCCDPILELAMKVEAKQGESS